MKALRCPIYEIKILRRICLRLARPGTQRDRPLMRPVTAPCSHDPPTLQEILCCSVGIRPVKAKTRPALTRHGEGRRVPARAFPPPPGPVLRLILKMKFAQAVPTRQSDRQVAYAPCNRRFVSRPDPGFACEAGASSGLPVPFKGGRSAARRVVSVGMLVHPRKRTKHGRRVPWPSGPR